MSKPRVLFVSKPIAEPFRDGSKCLVRDLCLELESVEAHVMGTGDRVACIPRAVAHAVYGSSGSYSPGLSSNLRAALWLLLRSRADLWHFVFAPNPRASQASRLLRRLRGVPSVQTIASPPRSFERPDELLFGDRIVAQSSWTRERFLDACSRARTPSPQIEVIPPPAPKLASPSDERVQAMRREFGVRGGEPLFVYPGDLEVSGGARFVLGLARALTETMPSARVVIAYRDKTNRAKDVAQELEAKVEGARVRFVRNAPDIHALLAAATAVLFPVDDLYGKVDLPIVLLEAMSLGVPVLALATGPLLDLVGSELLPAEPRRWVEALGALSERREVAEAIRARGLAATQGHFSAARVARLYEGVYRSLLPATAGC